MPKSMKSLILASSSPYRAESLRRLKLPFEQISPKIDEAALSGESTPELASRLAATKARAIALKYPDATVIGCDQVACLDGTALGKSMSRPKAIEQLKACSGKAVHFYSAIAVTESRQLHSYVDTTEVVFRPLDDRAIEHYLDKEPALDCAGSFKVEGLGIALFEAVRTDDPSALIGLPLIGLCRLLRKFDWSVP